MDVEKDPALSPKNMVLASSYRELSKTQRNALLEINLSENEQNQTIESGTPNLDCDPLPLPEMSAAPTRSRALAQHIIYVDEYGGESLEFLEENDPFIISQTTQIPSSEKSSVSRPLCWPPVNGHWGEFLETNTTSNTQKNRDHTSPTSSIRSFGFDSPSVNDSSFHKLISTKKTIGSMKRSSTLAPLLARNRESRAWEGEMTQRNIFAGLEKSDRRIDNTIYSKSVIQKETSAQRIKWVFKNKFDVNNQGYIGEEEFVTGVKEFNLDLGELEIRRLFYKLNNRSGGDTISLEEFIYSYHYNTLVETMVNLGQATNFSISSDYDWTETTASNYHLQELVFYGEFKRLRTKLDYSFHTNYEKNRQLWQDKVIKQVAVRMNPQPQPWIVYTCGPMGVGKGWVFTWMSKQGYFPLENIVHIDPDHFKSLMPEWEDYVEQNSETAGTLCHQESSYIQEIAQEVSLINQQNIWVDGSLKNTDWFCKVFEDIRSRYPMYKIAIFMVEATEEEIRKRIEIRRFQTGRDIPEEALKESLNAVGRSAKQLLPLCDFCARIDNSGEVPRLKSFERIDRSGNWDVIQRAFQKQPSIRDFPEHLAPLHLCNTRLTPNDFNYAPEILDTTETNLIQLYFSNPDFFRKRYNIGDHLLISPIDRDWSQHNISIKPVETFYIAYVYPATDKMCPEQDDLSPLFQYGGFMYFDRKKQLLSCNAIQKKWNQHSRVLLPFSSAHNWNHQWTLDLKDRFLPVTIPILRRRGAKFMCWLLPRENLGLDYKATQFGGMTFLFDEDMKPHPSDRYFPALHLS